MNDYRAGLNISPAARCALVLYESQTEQAWRANAMDLLQRYDILVVLLLGEIARRQFLATSQSLMERIRLVDTWECEVACDELIAFRFIEDLLIGRKIPVRILDSADRWLSSELSANYE